jgi:hypothetical protein
MGLNPAMRHLVSSIFIGVLVTGIVLPSQAAEPRELFQAAELAPADVDVYLHISNAAALRAQLSQRPLATWLAARLDGGELRDAWKRLARAVGREPDAFFDRLLGQDATLLMRLPRFTQPGFAKPDWVVISRVADAADLIKPLPQVIRGPVNGLSIRDVIEHDLQIAVNRQWLLIGPGRDGALFDDVVARIGREVAQPTLAADSAIAEARQLPAAPGPCAVAAYIRHAPPMGGWSAAVMGLDGDHMLVRHIAFFDHAPFTTPVTSRQFDLAPVRALGDRSLLALIEPTDAGDGLLTTFLKTQVPLVALEPPVNLGARRIWIVSETDARLAAPREDLLRPTLTRCDEVSDHHVALARLDHSMQRLGALQRDQVETFEPFAGVEDASAAMMPRIRHASLDDDLRAALGPGLLFDDVSLNWCCIGGSQGEWAIISTSSLAVGDAIKALSAPIAAEERRCGPWANAGVVRGRRLAQHLQSWVDHPRLMNELADASAGELKKSLAMIIQLADTIDDASWSMQRPRADRMRLDVDIRLAPPEQTVLPAASDEVAAAPKR